MSRTAMSNRTKARVCQKRLLQVGHEIKTLNDDLNLNLSTCSLNS